MMTAIMMRLNISYTEIQEMEHHTFTIMQETLVKLLNSAKTGDK